MENNNPLEATPDHVADLFENWFLDYASYVILDRAVPAIEDGLKPVQRRILHAMKQMDDGRFHKVANIIGQAMQYHPHGDQSIYSTIVGLGQKELLIETQGNWGDHRTGDRAAAPRYIEARLTPFALEVVFNSKTTNWQLSYDGRKKEPIVFPVKFPLLLAQGVEGIAVGLATIILPHNFIELCEAAIAYLRNQPFELMPDFPTGGLADFSKYTDGKRGGKVRVRAKIEIVDKKTLIIREIPFGTTTTSLIESIVKANDKGKIKIKKVVDNTAKDVEIEIQLLPGISPEVTLDALFATTLCENSISPNLCVIHDNKPVFLSVSDLLIYSTRQTLELLKRELEILRSELKEKLLFASLEKIFIENEIYLLIRKCTTWPDVIDTIHKGLDPYKPQFYRTITDDDCEALTEIKIKRITKFNTFKADELMRQLQADLEEVENNLAHITDYTIRYYQQLIKKYGAGCERKTEIKTFDKIEAVEVVANNQKLYVDRVGGFIGFGLKKEEYVCDCSDIDDIIAFKRDGTARVVKIEDKVFVGKDIIYVGVFRRNQDRMVYHLVYLDGESGISYVKRFKMAGVTRDKEYVLTKGTKGSKILHFSAQANGEGEVVQVSLMPSAKARIKQFDFDFGQLAIKNREAMGNQLTKFPIRKIKFLESGVSAFGSLTVHLDTHTGKMNTEGRGRFIGTFDKEDKILSITYSGKYQLRPYEPNLRFDPDQFALVEKFNPEKVYTAIYLDGESGFEYVKKFKIETTTVGRFFHFITEHKNSKLLIVTSHPDPQVEAQFLDPKGKPEENIIIDLNMIVDLKGWKAQGNRLSSKKLRTVKLISEHIIKIEPNNENDENPPQLSLF